MVRIATGTGGDFGNKERIIIETIIKSIGYKKAKAQLDSMDKLTKKLQKTTDPRLMKKYTRQLQDTRQQYQQNAKQLSDPGYLEKTAGNYQSFFKKVQSQGDEFVNMRTQQDQAVIKTQKKFGKGLVKNMRYVVDANGKMIDAATESVEKAKQHFNFGYLSIMFFGMAIKRATQQIIKSTMSTFNKIADGATEASRAVTTVSAEFEYLKFEVGRAIGQALVPLLPIIRKIARSVADFVQQHPEETFYSIAAVLAVGGAMSTLGQLGLFLQGLDGFKVSNQWTSFAGAGGSLARVSKLAKKGLKIGIGFFLVKDLMQDLSEDKYLSALGNALMVGSLIVPTKNPKATGALLAIGIGLKLISAILNKEDMYAVISEALTFGGMIVYSMGGGPLGLAVASIGIGMHLVGKERFKAAVYNIFAWVVKVATEVVANITEVLYLPFDSLVEAAVKIYNKVIGLFGGSKISYEPIGQRIAEMERQWASELYAKYVDKSLEAVGGGYYAGEEGPGLSIGGGSIATNEGTINFDRFGRIIPETAASAVFPQAITTATIPQQMSSAEIAQGTSSAPSERVFNINELNVNVNERYTDASSFLESIQEEVERGI